MTLRFRIVLLSACCLACSPAADPLSDADIEAIRRGEQEFVAAMLAGDVERMVAQRTADAVLYPPNALARVGPDGIRAWAATNPPILSFTVTPAETKGTGDLAYNRGTFSVTLVVGSDTIVDPGKYVQIWRRQADGNWRLGVEVWNSDTPLASPAPSPGR